ncbi:hypothetical protein [Paenibacillus bouchesdurhonensis]|uniref:hypothetical protein n=1 Tax=Paenibacillus bouchesdurhonensis TaxID=1870990 RepID=UPI000DA62590|nr:hypothetical protein [Paenibacillus bouchesdurhonensis]
MTTSNERNQQVVYQANPNAVQTMKNMKEQLHKVGKQYANRPVRVQTVDGVTYEGVLSHTDASLLFLVIPGQQTGPDPQYGHHDHYGHHGHYGHYGYPGHHEHYGHYGHHGGYPGSPMPTPYGSHGGGYAGYNRGLYGSYYYNNVILPLVLFELLVISLL